MAGNSFSTAKGTVIGWGLTEVSGEPADVLQEINVFIISNDECGRKGYDNITPKKICAEVPGSSKGTCFVRVIS